MRLTSQRLEALRTVFARNINAGISTIEVSHTVANMEDNGFRIVDELHGGDRNSATLINRLKDGALYALSKDVSLKLIDHGVLIEYEETRLSRVYACSKMITYEEIDDGQGINTLILRINEVVDSVKIAIKWRK